MSENENHTNDRRGSPFPSCFSYDQVHTLVDHETSSLTGISTETQAAAEQRVSEAFVSRFHARLEYLIT